MGGFGLAIAFFGVTGACAAALMMAAGLLPFAPPA